MKKELLEIRKYILLVLVGVFSYWALNNYMIFFNIIKTILTVLTPFILGGAIAFILNIPMSKIEKILKNKLKLSPKSTRTISIILSLLLFILVILFIALLLIPELIENIKMLIASIPQMVANIENFVVNLLDQSPDIQSQIKDMFSGSGNITSIFSSVLNYAINSSVDFVKSLVSGFVKIFTSIIFSIYMLMQKETIVSGSKKVLNAITSKENVNKIVEIAKLTNKTFSKFLTGQCLEACILGALMFVVLTIFRIPYALLISVLTSVTALIPVFGAWVAMIVGVILIMIISPTQAIIFALIFLILQQIENNFIYPKVVGASVGLSPMWTLIAITVGGNLFGVLGMLIGLPLASVLYSIFKKSINDKLKEKESINIENVA